MEVGRAINLPCTLSAVLERRPDVCGRATVGVDDIPQFTQLSLLDSLRRELSLINSSRRELYLLAGIPAM